MCEKFIRFINYIWSIHIYNIYISGGRSRGTGRELTTMGKQLVNFITCGCESSAPFLQFTKPEAVLVIGLYELLGNPTT
jgi:hypothetical protein